MLYLRLLCSSVPTSLEVVADAGGCTRWCMIQTSRNCLRDKWLLTRLPEDNLAAIFYWKDLDMDDTYADSRAILKDGELRIE